MKEHKGYIAIWVVAWIAGLIFGLFTKEAVILALLPILQYLYTLM